MDLWSIIGFLFWGYVFFAYLMVMFSIVGDIFRDTELNGWLKAVWILALIFLPVLTALVYLIARGRGMSERQREAARAMRSHQDEYIRSVASSSPADDIAKAKALLDDGSITQAEYDGLKAALRERLIAQRSSRIGTPTSAPPSRVMRRPILTSAGAGTKPPANSASPCRNRGDRANIAPGTKPKIFASSSRSIGDVIFIRARLSHCEMMLGWTRDGRWRRQQQPQPELAAFRRDLDDPLAHRDVHRAVRVGRAEVVRLVDHDQDRAPLLPLRPQVVEHGNRHDQRLVRGRRSRRGREPSRRDASSRMSVTASNARAQTAQSTRPRFSMRAASASAAAVPRSCSCGTISAPHRGRPRSPPGG